MVCSIPSGNPLGDDEPQRPPEIVEVFDDGDPEWIRPRSIASFPLMQTSLVEYRSEHDSAVEGCFWLSDPHTAKPKQALTDKDCPVLKLVQHLKHKGWLVSDTHVIHKDAQGKYFVGCEATRCRMYFQCLLSLPKILTLTREMPSRAPIAYYELLLHGKEAEPYKPAKTYQIAVNQELREKREIAEPLPIEDGPAAPVPGEDRIRIAQAEVPASEQQQKRSSAHGPSMPGKGRGKKREAVASGSGGAPVPIEPPPEPIGDPPGSGVVDPVPPSPPAPPAALDGEQDEDGIKLGGVVPAPKRRKVGREWKDALCGTKITYKEWPVAGRKPYRNYIIQCKRCSGGCHKTCGQNANNIANHWELEPLAFLHAWLDVEVPEGSRHSLADPDAGSVGRFLAEHEEELLELFHRLVPTP